MEDDLITAYNEAEYRVEGFSKPIYIGKHSEDADNVLSKNNLLTFDCFLNSIQIDSFTIFLF